MFQPASVALSGSAFSFLLYETCRSSIRQEGFLLGELIHKEITSITDNDQKQVDISKIIKINSVMPCLSNKYFVKGRVDKEKLRQFLGSNFVKVVAWYKYEPFSNFRFTLKDRALHKQFRELFEVASDLFSCCFVSMECTDNFSSYNYQQSFVRYFNGHFDRLNMHIPNLSESNNTYKNSEPKSAVFTKILSTLKVDIDSTKGLVAVTEIENAVQRYIDNTVAELAKEEKVLFDLEEEVAKLKKAFVPKSLCNTLDSVADANARNSKMDSSEDLILFKDNPPSEIHNLLTPEKSEGSPEPIKRTRSRSKPKQKTDTISDDVALTEETDSNKKEKAASVRNKIQNSPESQVRIPTPRGRSKGRGKKKI